MNPYETVRNEWSDIHHRQADPQTHDSNQPIRMTVKLGLILLFLVYLYVLVKVILFKFGGSGPEFYLRQLTESVTNPERIAQRLRLMSNLTPFHEISNNIQSLRSPTSFINFFGNIVAFMPLGFLLPLICGFRSMRLLKVLLISFGVSLALETAQLVLAIGTFDVDDMIMNTAGGVLGYALLWIMRLIFAPKPGRKPDEAQSGTASGSLTR